MRRFENKVAIVTGAGTGIGEAMPTASSAIAHKLAKEGAKVVANSLPYDPLEDVVASIKDYGGEATACCGNVSQESEASKCVQTAIDTYGQLDILVNNAGVFLAVAETEDYPIEAFDRTLRMNLRSAFLMTKFALPHLQIRLSLKFTTYKPNRIIFS